MRERSSTRSATVTSAGSSAVGGKGGAMSAAGQKAERIRQAVVVVHGMGEQRPLDALNEFILAGLPPENGQRRGPRRYYSRPDKVTDSYESRRYLAPRNPGDPTQPAAYEQTEFYEYHWAHLMQGNKFGDIWPTFTRLLLRLPDRVPHGLGVLWSVSWAIVILIAFFFFFGPGSRLDLTGSPIDILLQVVGTSVVAVGLVYVLVTLFGLWVTTGFVDVVRYLDTTPRSYEVRRDVRAGMIKLLEGLHSSDSRYQRIIIVAHSLGSYIAYDAITYLWGQMNQIHAGPAGPGGKGTYVPAGLEEVERLASEVTSGTASPAQYQAAQRTLWLGIRANGNPWKVTDLITFGSPMYFADSLITRKEEQFRRRVGLREIPTCPPQPDQGSRSDPPAFSHPWAGRKVLYHAAPFAVTRWTNMWFPARARLLGDNFGGPLAPLFGSGVRDIKLTRNDWKTRVPGWAHARYYHYPDVTEEGTVTAELRAALALDSADWLPVDP